jgi:2,3-dihydroxyphenylpropionate 1,2-dioxygenase
MVPSGHHDYASLGWFSALAEPPETNCPLIKPALVELSFALHGLAHEEASRAVFLADAAGYADRFSLTAAQREALIVLDTRAIVAMGAHPLVPFLASMQVEGQSRGHRRV